MEELFDDIRKLNMDWRIFESDKYSSVRYPAFESPKKPKSADEFILELNEKYIVVKK